MEQNQPQKAKRSWLSVALKASVIGAVVFVVVIILGVIFAPAGAPSSNAEAERWEAFRDQQLRELGGAK